MTKLELFELLNLRNWYAKLGKNPSYLITEMFIQPKTCWNIKKNYYSDGNQLKTKICKGSLEIFLFTQITNFFTDLCCILAVF